MQKTCFGNTGDSNVIDSNYQGGTASQCEKKCTEKEQCNFYYFNDATWCSLFKKCDATRPAGKGNTYQKKSEGMLLRISSVDKWKLQGYTHIMVVFKLEKV